MKKINIVIMMLLAVSILTIKLYSQNNFQKDEAKAFMDMIQSGDYDTLLTVSKKIYITSARGKYTPDSTNMIDVIVNLGVMGSENEVKSTSASQNYAEIRMYSALSLGAIGGDNARKAIFRIASAEKNPKAVQVVTAVLVALSQVGDDETYSALKMLRFIYNYMPKNNTGDVANSLVAFVQCVHELTKDIPLPIINRFEIIDALKELVNENTKFAVYPPIVRKAAKDVMTEIIANAI